MQMVYDWTGPAEWICPACEAPVLTAEAAPRCRVCGFRDTGD
jgi:rubrerythrin